MINTKKVAGIALATAAAGLFALAPMSGSTAEEAAAAVKCGGINACKGKSDCKTATNDCHGQNACKGQGWMKLSEDECKTKGGENLGTPEM
jgi:Predicted integral membrane protein (DUF2282).